jgi:predicted transposase YbfD/YdcC
VSATPCFGSFPLSAPAPSTTVPPLSAFLAAVPDRRSRQGLRHRLPAILALACAALLCGVRGYQSIAQWGRDYPSEVMRTLGFTRKTPCGSTLHEVFTRLDWDGFAAQIHAWAAAVMTALTPADEAPPLDALALDGKTLRGSLKQEAEIAHMVSVVSHRLGLVLAQAGVSCAGEEPTVVAELLRGVDLRGRVVTVDALHTQREVAEQICEAGGDYLMTVKRNQPLLLEEVQALFAPHLAEGQDRELMVTRGKKEHGRLEERRLTAITVPEGSVDWPGVAQVFLVERLVMHLNRPVESKKRHTRAVAYGITSLSREKATAEALLKLNREHWTIENKAHWVRDVVLGEDASQVASGKIARVMSAVRSTVLNLMRSAKEQNIAAATRRMAARPWDAVRLLGFAAEN